MTHEVMELLNRISTQLRRNSELAEARRDEWLADIHNLRSELQRATPRQGIIRDILSTLGNVASISGLVMQVQQYLQSLPH